MPRFDIPGLDPKSKCRHSIYRMLRLTPGEYAPPTPDRPKAP